MYCRRCGKPIQAGDEFCVYCGEPVSDDPRLREEGSSAGFAAAGGSSSFLASAGGIALIIAIAVIVMGGVALSIVLAVHGSEGNGVADQANQQTSQPQGGSSTTTGQGQVSSGSSGSGGQSSQTQESGQGQSSTNNQTPSTSNQTPSTNNQTPSTNNQTPPTNNQTPPTNNQTADDCYAALLKFARESAATWFIPIDPASVRLEYFGMESPTLGGAVPFGYATEYGADECMGACWAEYRDGTWVCWWEDMPK